MNGSLQTLERPTHTPATNALKEALERFDRTSVRLGLDSATTALLRASLRVHRERVSLRDAAYLIAVESVAHACRERGWV